MRTRTQIQTHTHTNTDIDSDADIYTHTYRCADTCTQIYSYTDRYWYRQIKNRQRFACTIAVLILP